MTDDIHRRQHTNRAAVESYSQTRGEPTDPDPDWLPAQFRGVPPWCANADCYSRVNHVTLYWCPRCDDEDREYSRSAAIQKQEGAA